MMDLFFAMMSVACVLGGIYLWARVLIPRLAEENKFFTSPKLGRIVARRRSGKIVRFYSNLVGKDVHADEKTGKIVEGEVLGEGFWWNLFGVYFIGLDDVYTYQIATEATETPEGELSYVEMPASSIFLAGLYSVTAIYTSSDGVRFKVKVQLGLETVHAGIALSLPISWTILVFKAVMATIRDYFGSKSAIQILGGRFEGTEIGDDKPELLQKILNLDTNTGNPALADVCGQRIVTVNFDIDFADDKTREQFTSPYAAKREAEAAKEKATGEADALVEKAGGEARAAAKLAEAKVVAGKAEAEIFAAVLTGCNGDMNMATRVIEAMKLADMKGLTTLVQGGSKTPISIPLQE